MKNAFMIAATGSGCGKTTITCALLKAIKDRKLTPKSFKCGPDYIDPMFHKAVLGIEAQNLDLFFSDEEEINEIFYGEDSCDVSVVEGVMGLYDGITVDSNDGSSYDLACKLDIPVVLIVDAHGMGRSLIALIKGFQAMDNEGRIKAVIINHISPMYYETISRQIEKELGIKVLGYFPKMDNLKLESRYLGLKLPEEIENLENDLNRAAEKIAESVDIDKLLEITRVDEAAIKEKILAKEKYLTKAKNNEANAKVRIGVARDEAFCFYYEENFKLLRKLGAELVFFSPLNDKVLPEGLDGLLLGGGYPELHAKELSANKSMLDSIQNAISQGTPSLAECGGFMYLHSFINVEGTSYPMVGVIDGFCEKKSRLVRFGYMIITENESNFIVNDNRRVKGHEFHYYDSSNNGECAISEKPNSKRSWMAAHITDNHWWGFAHLYYPSNKLFAESFVDKCRKYKH